MAELPQIVNQTQVRPTERVTEPDVNSIYRIPQGLSNLDFVAHMAQREEAEATVQGATSIFRDRVTAADSDTKTLYPLPSNPKTQMTLSQMRLQAPMDWNTVRGGVIDKLQAAVNSSYSSSIFTGFMGDRVRADTANYASGLKADQFVEATKNQVTNANAAVNAVVANNLNQSVNASNPADAAMFLKKASDTINNSSLLPGEKQAEQLRLVHDHAFMTLQKQATDPLAASGLVMELTNSKLPNVAGPSSPSLSLLTPEEQKSLGDVARETLVRPTKAIELAVAKSQADNYNAAMTAHLNGDNSVAERMVAARLIPYDWGASITGGAIKLPSDAGAMTDMDRIINNAKTPLDIAQAKDHMLAYSIPDPVTGIRPINVDDQKLFMGKLDKAEKSIVQEGTVARADRATWLYSHFTFGNDDYSNPSVPHLPGTAPVEAYINDVYQHLVAKNVPAADAESQAQEATFNYFARLDAASGAAAPAVSHTSKMPVPGVVRSIPIPGSFEASPGYAAWKRQVEKKGEVDVKAAKAVAGAITAPESAIAKAKDVERAAEVQEMLKEHEQEEAERKKATGEK